MALTPVQKQKMLRYIGWSDSFVRDELHRLYSATVESRFTDLSPEAEEDASALLQRILDIDNQLQKSIKRLTVNSVGNIRLNRREISMLRAERRRIIEEMKIALYLFSPDFYISGAPD